MRHLRDVLAPRLRPLGLASARWVYGIATTIVLMALWGRSVAADEATLAESAEAVLASGYVHDRVDAWATEALAATVDASPAAVAPVVDRIAASPELDAALDGAFDDIVDAALAPTGQPLVVDVSTLLDDVVPVAEAAFADAGLPVEASALRNAVDGAPDVVLTDDDLAAAASATLTTRAVLTRAVLVGLGVMAAAGAMALATSEDRLRQARDLATRIALSGLGFAVFLRVGAWAVDPSGGRSPIGAGGSVLLGSNGHVPLLAAGVGVVGVVVATLVIRHRRRLRLAAGIGDDTGEVRVLEPVR